ncbi:putative MFS-type transporter [Smittium culicis]|uniref:Putative MFS-type transporter n=2 Tax=Smittium culicis TaxID=133412 RepID=A0A1R1YCF8_9FUNG|nr:putative MFS-type transporter [Smittium culicis]
MPMIIGFLILTVSSIPIGFSNKLYQLFLARLFQGISSGVTWSLGLAMLIDVYPSDKLDFPISISYSGFTLGVLGGPVLGGVVYKSGGMPGVAYLMGGMALFNMIFRILVPDSNELNEILAKSEAVSSSSIDLESNPENSQPAANKKINFFSLLKEKQIIVLCLVTIFAYGMTSSIELVLPIVFAEKFDLSPDIIGYTFISFSVSSVIGSLVTGRLMDSKFINSRISEYKKRYVIIIIGNTVAGVLVIITGFQKTLAAFIIFMALFGFASGCGNVPVMAALGAHITYMATREDTHIADSKNSLSPEKPEVTQEAILETPVPVLANHEIKPDSNNIEENSDTNGTKSVGKSGGNGQVYSLYNVSYSLSALIIPIVASSMYKSAGLLPVCAFLGGLLAVGVSTSVGYILLTKK